MERQRRRDLTRLAPDHLGAWIFVRGEVHQFAGRVVDVDEQGALRATVLEPPVLRPIDLVKLAAAVPAITRLIKAWSTGIAVLPEPG